MSESRVLASLRPAPAKPTDNLTDQAAGVSNQVARALLAEVVARLGKAHPPIVQVMAACRSSQASSVSLRLAIAAVSGYGRTLLVADGNAHGPVARTLRLSGKAGASATPDATVPGLYHRHFDESLLDQEQVSAASGRGSAKAFRMLILASQSPVHCPAGLSHATRCHGTILAVAAGVTRLSDVLATARQLELAGGAVLGTVLYDAPRFRLWPKSDRSA